METALRDSSLHQIADAMAKVPAGSRAYEVLEVELKRRQAEAVVQGAKAQKDSARYMLWAVLAVLLTSAISAVASAWEAYY